MSHYRRDVVGRGISTGLGLGLRRRLSGGALPVLFGWNPEIAQTLPATATFTRASVAQVLTTTDGTTFWYQETKLGELRLYGMRRVENLLDSSNGTGPFTAVTKDGRLAVSVIADTGTLTITIGGTPQVFTPTGAPQRFVAFDDATGGSTTVAISGTATLSQPMAHLCQVGNDVPEPYVQHDAEFLNIGVNGVTYFNTANTSTVDGSGVATFATGTTITGGGYLPEPAATNQITDSDDFNAASWSQGGITSIVDDGVNSLGLRQHTITIDTANVQHRIFDSSVQQTTGYVIAKQGTGRYIILRVGASSPNDYSVFDLQAGTVTEDGSNATGRITDLGDGFYKCETTTSSQNSFFVLSVSDTGTPGSGAYSFTGASETILLCHAQGEDTAFSTSPIITSGSTVTRVADVLTANTVLSGKTEFSIFADVTTPEVVGVGFADDNAMWAIAIDQRVTFFDSGTKIIHTNFGPGGYNITGGDADTRFKVTTRYKSEDTKTFISGSSQGDATAYTPDTSLFIGYNGAGNTKYFRGRMHLITAYGVALDDASSEALVA